MLSLLSSMLVLCCVIAVNGIVDIGGDGVVTVASYVVGVGFCVGGDGVDVGDGDSVGDGVDVGYVVVVGGVGVVVGVVGVVDVSGYVVAWYGWWLWCLMWY